MKLRIRGNSLRLRLTRSEVARLGATGRVSETIKFGAGQDQQLTYALESSQAAEKITARFDRNQITVTLPSAEARVWVETETVGLSNEQETPPFGDRELLQDGGDGRPAPEPLKLLVEKDFVCIDGDPAEDQSDAFPNPNLSC